MVAQNFPRTFFGKLFLYLGMGREWPRPADSKELERVENPASCHVVLLLLLTPATKKRNFCKQVSFLAE